VAATDNNYIKVEHAVKLPNEDRQRLDVETSSGFEREVVGNLVALAVIFRSNPKSVFPVSVANASNRPNSAGWSYSR